MEKGTVLSGESRASCASMEVESILENLKMIPHNSAP